MKRQADPYMVAEDDSEDDSHDDDSPKRPRLTAGGLSGGGFSGGFSKTAADGDVDGDTAESQLEAMLATEGVPAVAGRGAGVHLAGFGASGPAAFTTGETRVEPTPMDFSRLVQNMPSREVPVPKNLVEHLMTPQHRGLLAEETGADVEWVPEEAQVKLRGSAEQVKRATRLLQRVLMHCHWGRSEAKVARLLRPYIVESAICRLSPMNSLRPVEKVLNNSSPILSIGKDKGNDVTIQDPVISRQHCILELDPERGAVYALDTSTNGTFLNGIRLPSKTVGKVLLSHGDELLFKDPTHGEQEFGYIVNLNELNVRPHVKLEAPRRLLTPEEMSSISRDFA